MTAESIQTTGDNTNEIGGDRIEDARDALTDALTAVAAVEAAYPALVEAVRRWLTSGNVRRIARGLTVAQAMIKARPGAEQLADLADGLDTDRLLRTPG